MDSIILIKQLFVLFAMIATGYCAFRLKFFGKIGQHEISTLIAKILTPAFILSSVMGEYPERGSRRFLSGGSDRGKSYLRSDPEAGKAETVY